MEKMAQSEKSKISRYHNNAYIQEGSTSSSSLILQLRDFDINVDELYKDEDCMLLNLFKSILSVDNKYLLFTEKETSKSHYHVERVFAYELYRQWANRIQILYDNKYLINGEIGKTTSLFDQFSSLGYKFPDLVLHQSQGNCDYQGVVCEIKTSNVTRPSFKEDIEKLCCFVCGDNEKYRFSFGVFILVGVDIKRILDLMDEIDHDVFKANLKERMERVICVAYNDGWLETTRLDWLINNRTDLRESLK